MVILALHLSPVGFTLKAWLFLTFFLDCTTERAFPLTEGPAAAKPSIGNFTGNSLCNAFNRPLQCVLLLSSFQIGATEAQREKVWLAHSDGPRMKNLALTYPVALLPPLVLCTAQGFPLFFGFTCDMLAAACRRKALERVQSPGADGKGLEITSSQTALQVVVSAANQETQSHVHAPSPHIIIWGGFLQEGDIYLLITAFPEPKSD